MFKNNKKLFLILGGALLFLIILRIFFSLTKPPQLIKTNPSHQESGVELNSEIILTFDKDIKKELLTIQTYPPINYLVSISGTTATLTPQKSYLPQTTYSLKIYYKNQHQQNLSFTTQQAQSNPRQIQEIQERVERQYPLATLTPYETQNYSVTYTNPLTLEIEMLSNNISSKEAIQLVKNWVSSQGLDPKTHTYITKSPQDIQYETEITR